MQNIQLQKIKVHVVNLFQAQLLDTDTTTPHLNEGMALHFGTSWPAEEL